MKLKVLLLTALLAIAVRPAFAAQNHEKDVSAIRQVIEAFRLAIIERDRSSFTALFFSPDPQRVNWQFVNEDARMARLQSVRAAAKQTLAGPDLPTNLAVISRNGSTIGRSAAQDRRRTH